MRHPNNVAETGKSVLSVLFPFIRSQSRTNIDSQSELMSTSSGEIPNVQPDTSSVFRCPRRRRAQKTSLSSLLKALANGPYHKLMFVSEFNWCFLISLLVLLIGWVSSMVQVFYGDCPGCFGWLNYLVSLLETDVLLALHRLRLVPRKDKL